MADLDCTKLPDKDWQRQLLDEKLPGTACRFHFSKETLPVGELVPFIKAKDKELVSLVESKLNVRVLVTDAQNIDRAFNGVLKNWKLSDDQEQNTIDYFIRTRKLDLLPRDMIPIEFVPPHFYGEGEALGKRPQPDKGFFLMGAGADRKDLIKLVMYALNYNSNDHAQLMELNGALVDRRTAAGLGIQEHAELLKQHLANGSPEPFTTNTILTIWNDKLDELERDFNKRFDINSFALDNAKLLKLNDSEKEIYALNTFQAIGLLSKELNQYDLDKIKPVPGMLSERYEEVKLRIGRIEGKIEEMRSRFKPDKEK